MGTVMNESRRQILLDTPHTETATGAIATFETDMVAPAKEVRVEIEPVQEGEGDPSPENVRPITGWNGVNVHRTGKNLWGGTAFMALADNWTGAVTNTTDMTVTGKISNLTTRAKVFEYPFKANTRYTIFMQASVNNTGLYVVYTDGTEASISTPVYVTNATKTVSYLRFYISTSSDITFYANGIGVMEGVLTQEDFEPYTGSTTPISWADEAGTVYGGTLEWEKDGSVTLTKTMQGVILSGSEANWTAYVSVPKHYQITVDGNKPNTSTEKYAISNYYTSKAGANSAIVNEGVFSVDASRIRFKDARFETLSDFLAWVQQIYSAGSPLMCVYELATPVTYTLTPTEALTLLRGANNVWNDINDTTVTYWTHKMGDSV